MHVCRETADCFSTLVRVGHVSAYLDEMLACRTCDQQYNQIGNNLYSENKGKSHIFYFDIGIQCDDHWLQQDLFSNNTLLLCTSYIDLCGNKGNQTMYVCIINL